MAEFRLHCFAESGNAYKPALFLAMAGVDWEPVKVDFFDGATRTADYRALNEMGEVPVLEHKGETVTQSAVILDYLAAVTRVLEPDAEIAREVLRWQMFDAHKLSGSLGTWRFVTRFLPAEKRSADVAAFLEARAKGALATLERHLEGRDWMVGDRLTLADLSTAGYLFYEDEYDNLDWADYPNIGAWRTRLRAEPGWAAPYDLMPRAAPV